MTEELIKIYLLFALPISALLLPMQFSDIERPCEFALFACIGGALGFILFPLLLLYGFCQFVNRIKGIRFIRRMKK